MAMLERLNSRQMASFAARCFLRFDTRVPGAINAQFMEDAGGRDPENAVPRDLRPSSRIPEVPAGAPMVDAYQDGTALGRLVVEHP